MYRFINYGKLFEQTDPAAPMPAPQVQPAAQPLPQEQVTSLMLVLSAEDITELANLIQSNADAQLFIRPAQIVDKNTMNPTGETNVVLAISSSDTTAAFPSTEGLDQTTHTIFNVYPKQLVLDELENSPVTTVLTSTTGQKFSITLAKSGTQTPAEPVETEPEMTTTETPEETSVVPAEQVEDIADSGEMTAGMNPRSIKSFDAFVQESKKTWIKDVPMEKGALRKEMGKKKGDDITAKELAKSEAKLKKKDKNKKKPGLQLNPKDAKTHKRNVLAKNLMKASGAIQESRQERIKGTKDALVKLHEVIEKMIKQTSLKNKGI